MWVDGRTSPSLEAVDLSLRKGKVGIGYGKAKEVPAAIQKGMENARREMILVPMAGQTLIHKIVGEHGASRVLLQPAAPGTGVIAGGPVRSVLEAAGVRNILTKSLGTSNPHNVVKAALDGLKHLRSIEDVAETRGLKVMNGELVRC